MDRYTPQARALAALLARIAVGVVFIAHGWQKLVDNGMDATTEAFTGMGVPAPGVSAWYAALVELVGGAALIVGLLLPLFGALLFIDMAGAFIFVHGPNGIFLSDGGFEYVLVLGLASLLLGVAGGPLALDRLVFRRRAAQEASEREAVGSVS